MDLVLTPKTARQASVLGMYMPLRDIMEEGLKWFVYETVSDLILDPVRSTASSAIDAAVWLAERNRPLRQNHTHFLAEIRQVRKEAACAEP